MKHAAIITLALCFIATAALAAGKPKAPQKASDKDKASLVVADFLKAMDAKSYDKAFTFIDFDTLIKDQLKVDTATLPPGERDKKVKVYQSVIKSMFEGEKKQVKFKNFSIGAFNKAGNTATLELVNSPPKGSTEKPIVKTFKMILNNNKWLIYGIAQKPAKK